MEAHTLHVPDEDGRQIEWGFDEAEFQAIRDQSAITNEAELQAIRDKPAITTDAWCQSEIEQTVSLFARCDLDESTPIRGSCRHPQCRRLRSNVAVVGSVDDVGTLHDLEDFTPEEPQSKRQKHGQSSNRLKRPRDYAILEPAAVLQPVVEVSSDGEADDELVLDPAEPPMVHNAGYEAGGPFEDESLNIHSNDWDFAAVSSDTRGPLASSPPVLTTWIGGPQNRFVPVPIVSMNLWVDGNGLLCDETVEKLFMHCLYASPYPAGLVEKLLEPLTCEEAESTIVKAYGMEQAGVWFHKLSDVMQHVFPQGSRCTALLTEKLQRGFPEYHQLDLKEIMLCICGQTERIRSVIPDEHLLDFVEFCAGSGNLTKECTRTGMRGVALDRIHSTHHDVFTRIGSRRWVQVGCFLRPRRRRGMKKNRRNRSFKWYAPTCKSFVWVSRGTSKRCPEQMFGDESQLMVKEGNELVPHVAFGSVHSLLMDIDNLVEQPVSSIMNDFPCFASYLDLSEAAQSSTWLGAHGADSPKCIKVWNTGEWFPNVCKPKPPADDNAVRLCVKSGRWVTGTSSLGDSECYPCGLGSDVAAEWWEANDM